MNQVPLRSVIKEYIGGGWGKEAPDRDHTVPASVIRGTDLDDVQSGVTDAVPYRWHKPSSARTRTLGEGDIVFEVSGGSKDQPVGRSLLLDAARLARFRGAAIPASFCKRIIPNRNVVDPRFLLAHLQAAWADRRIVQWQVQSTGICNFNFEAFLDDFIIDLPSLPSQRRIAGILSAYDELIENSERRIRILESISRALYRKWFVHFRFPGHESIRHVPSSFGDIPEGWEVSTLGAHLAALETGKRPKGGIRQVRSGVPSIGAENINGIGQHNFAAEKFVPREFFLGMRKGVVRDRDVAIYKDGAYIGRSSYFRDGFPHAECSVNEHVFLLRGDGVRLKQNALYLWLQDPDTVQTIRSRNANAAQPGINQQTLSGLELLLPDQHIAELFDELVEPLLAAVINLAKIIQNLRRTREVLLPRLLSGEISVEAVAL